MDITNITTELFEGVLYPHPSVYPDENNASKKSDTGEVRYEFNRLDLDDYALPSGKLDLNTSLGITEQHLYISARKVLETTYEDVVDIQLGQVKFITTTAGKNAVIRYKVEL
jgi:hypothetical protein